MERLVKIGLYGNGLVPVRTPRLIERYNQCLQEIGIEPTGLSGFDIDGMGWSPQVAQEKNNLYYLAHGDANPFTVILTPDQRGKPVYFPIHSFDRDMMSVFFTSALSEIADLSTDTGMWLDLDNGISEYASVADILFLDTTTIRVHTAGPLREAVRIQQRLSERFVKEQDAWTSEALRKEIIESATAYGDVRARKINVTDTVYTHPLNFYIHLKQFGTVYIFREGPQIKVPIIVTEDPSFKPDLKRKQADVFSLKDDVLPAYLLDVGLAEINLDFYREHIQYLLDYYEMILIDVFVNEYPDVRYVSLNDAQRKKYIVALDKKLPEVFFELERLVKMLQSSRASGKYKVSRSLSHILMRPSSHLDAKYQDVVWNLFGRMGFLGPLMLYTYDKNLFFAMYKEWHENKKEWASELLHKFYVPWAARTEEKITKK